MLRPDPTAKRTADLIVRGLSTRDLASDVRARSREVHRLGRTVRELSERTAELAFAARSRLRSLPKPPFLPLVVEGDAENANRMVRALEKADVYSPLPVVRGRDEAVRILDPLSRSDARGLGTMPTVLLVDSELPEDGALAVLRHARSLPAFSGIPVILMTPPGERSRVNRAYEAGVNSVVERPTAFDALVRCLETLKSY